MPNPADCTLPALNATQHVKLLPYMKLRVCVLAISFSALVGGAGLSSAHGMTSSPALAPQTSGLNVRDAERFAGLALACVHKEYPNKLGHSLNSDADVAPPRQLTPAFYGCYDWHSSVHGHWLLARLARSFPEASFASQARAALQQSLSEANIKQEAAYLKADGRASFERPYGLAWLLQLAAELREWDDPLARKLSGNLRPLEEVAGERLKTWLPKLSHPIRSGEHSQTAFALGLLLDYARSSHDQAFLNLLSSRAKDFYGSDVACPLAYEPSGEDFLSPCLAEADVMRRVLPPPEFASWLRRFLPQVTTNGSDSWLRPEKSTDPSDPKLAHIDGLNLSRAWMLEGIASALPAEDARRSALSGSSNAHRIAGLAAVTGEHYEGGHWLGSFATYLVTRRGIEKGVVTKVGRARQIEQSNGQMTAYLSLFSFSHDSAAGQAETIRVPQQREVSAGLSSKEIESVVNVAGEQYCHHTLNRDKSPSLTLVAEFALRSPQKPDRHKRKWLLSGIRPHRMGSD